MNINRRGFYFDLPTDADSEESENVVDSEERSLYETNTW